MSEETISRIKSTGQLNTITIKLGESCPINIDEMPFNQLTMFVGANGTGKTFILKTAWMLGFICNLYVRMKEDNITFDANGVAQLALDGAFKVPDFTGVMKATYHGNCDIEVQLENGKVTNVALNGFENIVEFPPTRFLSSDMRTFDAISMYLRLRKTEVERFIRENPELTNPDKGLISAIAMARMRDNGFMMYDIMHIEQMIARCPLTFPDIVKKHLVEDFDFDEGITSLDIDLEKSDFFVMIGDVKKYMLTYGKGHQSMLNMTCANL